MIEIKLTTEEYIFIQKKAPSFKVEFPVNDSYRVNHREGCVVYEVDSEDTYEQFMTALNFAIVFDGMDNQDTVNEVGRELYKIYDAICYGDNDHL